MTPLRLIYITTENREQALALGRALVERRLAACINVLGGMTSVYHWQGNIEESTEAVLLAKTDESRVDALVAAVKELHSYDVPCALVLPIVGGNPDYLDWLATCLK